MFELIWEAIISSGSIWCGLCIFLMYKNDQKYERLAQQYERLDQRHDELEVYVRNQVTKVVEENTKVLTRVEDMFHANFNRR
jgi:hypothetical protein